jgi:signal transduction histidine kinase
VIRRPGQGMTLRQLAYLSWAIPGALVACASLGAFLVAGWVDYRSSIDRVRDDLVHKSRIASRRLSAELLLGSSGAVEAVTQSLVSDLRVARLAVQPGPAPCANLASNGGTCVERQGASLTVYRAVEHVRTPHHVALTQSTVPFANALNPTLFLWSALPVALLLAVGLLFQRRLLRRHVLGPISSLVETSVHAQDPPAHWPIELQDLSHRLARSFEDRDQAVFGRIAGGVIHDLRTLLQSVRSATELVQEAPVESPKRASRLEALARTTAINVPKMLALIEQTLDGCREIPVQPHSTDLSRTIQGAVEVNEHLAKARKVGIQLQGGAPCDIDHDPVQLERALTNLIKNGIEAFGPAEAPTQARERIVRISAQAQGADKISLSVEDSGPGFPYGTDRAFRLLRSTKVHGTGLGLLIARKIVEGHGGTIEARQSSDLAGAAFVIELPVHGGRKT